MGMKVMKAMKAMKVKAAKPMKKAMKVSIIGKGKLAKSAVFSGKKERTVGGLKKADLVKSKSGKVVSKKASVRAKKNYQGSKLQKWAKALTAARKALGVKGFVACKKGTPLYNKAKALM